MVNPALEAAPVLGGVDMNIGANQILERDDLALVSVAIPLSGDAALEAAMNAGISLEMPEPTLSSLSGDTRAIRTAPDQLMLLFPESSATANSIVQSKLNGTGYTTDQTGAWVVLEICGPDTLAALGRLSMLDLDSGTFPVNASARTVMEHMGAMLIRVDADRFLLLSASSLAASFLHAVVSSYRNVMP